MNEEPWRLEVPPWLYLLSVASLLLTAAAAGYIYLGGVLTAPLVLAGAAALLAWAFTTYRAPRQRRSFPLLIVVVIALLLQGLEQWTFGYPQIVREAFPFGFAAPVVFDERIFLSVYVLAATTLFLAGGFGVLFHHPLGNFTAWLLCTHAMIQSCFLIGACLLAEVGPRYVPGAAAAPLCLLLGLLGALRLARAKAEA